MCSMASLLFLRIGLLPFFNPFEQRKQEAKKRCRRTLSKLLKHFVVLGQQKSKRAKRPGGGDGDGPPPQPPRRKGQQQMGGQLELDWAEEAGPAEEQSAPTRAGAGEGHGDSEREKANEVLAARLREEAEMSSSLEWLQRSRSTSDLPGDAQEHKELEEERQRQHDGMGERQTVAFGESSDGEVLKRRKKSFKICKCVTNSEVLLFRSERLPHIAPAQKPPVPLMPMQQQQQNGHIGGSRFRITPVENRYKRGRWEAWDHYEADANAKKCAASPTARTGALPPMLVSTTTTTKSGGLSPPPSSEVSPQQQQKASGQQQTPSPSQLPRRNSFQLVQIRNLVELERRGATVPGSIAEEKQSPNAQTMSSTGGSRSLSPDEPTTLQRQGNNGLHSSASSSASRAATPRIVEPENGIIDHQQQRQRGTDAAGWTSLGTAEQIGANGLPTPTFTLYRPVSPSAAAVPNPELMLQQFGLERSLSIECGGTPTVPIAAGALLHQNGGGTATPQLSASFGPGQMQFSREERPHSEGRAAMLARRSSSASTGAVAAAQKASDGTAVAIDSKIEQAMDLVKTHLIYAVRDEMEVLRSRIVHLEATLAQLEAENAVLREHIPREVLDSLPPLDPTTNGHQQTAKQSSLQPMASAPATAVQMVFSEVVGTMSFLRPQCDDDSVDRLHYYYTPTFLLVVAVLISLKMFGGSPIECWLPAEFRPSWQEYTELVCWSMSTYFVRGYDTPEGQANRPRSANAKREATLAYYQWTPFFLVFSAVLFYSPCVVWRQLSAKSGLVLNEIVAFATAVDQCPTQQNAQMRAAKLRGIAAHLSSAFRLRLKWRNAPEGDGGQAKSLGESIRYHRAYLAVLYMCIKVLSLGTVLAQACLMNRFLQTDDYDFYGWGVLRDLLQGRAWSDSGNFPRITFCDIDVRIVGAVQRYTVQCILVINIFTEKVFVLLWLWYSLLLLITAFNVLGWLLSLLSFPARREFIVRRLLLADDQFDEHEQSDTIDMFVRDFLSTDGCFVLRMLDMHTVEWVNAEIVDAVWEEFVSQLDQQERQTGAAAAAADVPMDASLGAAEEVRKQLLLKRRSSVDSGALHLQQLRQRRAKKVGLLEPLMAHFEDQQWTAALSASMPNLWRPVQHQPHSSVPIASPQLDASTSVSLPPAVHRQLKRPLLATSASIDQPIQTRRPVRRTLTQGEVSPLATGGFTAVREERQQEEQEEEGH